MHHEGMGIILNPAVEVQRQPEEFSAFSGVLSFEAVAFGCRLVESAKQPAFRLASGLSSAHLSGASLYQRFMV